GPTRAAPTSLATASGTCTRRRGAERSASACCRAGTARTSSSAPARCACSTTPRICCSISTSWHREPAINSAAHGRPLRLELLSFRSFGNAHSDLVHVSEEHAGNPVEEDVVLPRVTNRGEHPLPFGFGRMRRKAADHRKFGPVVELAVRAPIHGPGQRKR